MNLPDVPGNPPAADDSALIHHFNQTELGTVWTLPDHSHWEWIIDHQPIQGGQPALLRFRVFDKDGKPASDSNLT